MEEAMELGAMEDYQWIRDPLSVVNELLEAGRSVKEYFDEKLSEAGRLKVPLLNPVPVQCLRHHSLVRYRCMIQDQFDPEFYFKVYYLRKSADISSSSVPCSGLFRDLNHHPIDSEIDLDNRGNVTADRQTLYCVPIPGETPWVKCIYKEEASSSAGVADLGGESGSAASSSADLVGESDDRRHKRKLSEIEEEESLAMNKVSKVSQPESASVSADQLISENDFNFPIPWESGTPCLVKVYDHFEQYKVATSIEVFGVLSTDPALAHLDTLDPDQYGMETASERKVHSPPPSLIPRLHAITVRHLDHTNPLLPWQLRSPFKRTEVNVAEVQATRKLLLNLLTEVLMGDELAAELTLLHLLSSVHGRTELIAIGKFALNISNCSLLVVSNLQQLLHRLLTKNVYLRLSLDQMNKWRFSPKKDYNANRLTSGILQLTKGSHILVDETALAPGKLNETGLRNLTALGNIIQWQTLHYDFQYHTSEFHTDLQVLIASQTKSILQVDCHVPLEPTTDCVSFRSLSDTELLQLRKYLSLHRLLSYTLTDQVQKGLEEDFVSLRQNDPEMTGAKFQYLLSLSRLLSLSYGCDQLSVDLWTQAKHLDELRSERLKC